MTPFNHCSSRTSGSPGGDVDLGGRERAGERSHEQLVLDRKRRQHDVLHGAPQLLHQCYALPGHATRGCSHHHVQLHPASASQGMLERCCVVLLHQYCIKSSQPVWTCRPGWQTSWPAGTEASQLEHQGRRRVLSSAERAPRSFLCGLPAHCGTAGHTGTLIMTPNLKSGSGNLAAWLPAACNSKQSQLPLYPRTPR